MKHKAITKMLLTAVCLVNSAAWATTLYVNGVSGSDSNNNCTSSLAPCKTIGHAISVAATGETIKVAAATYTENLNIGISLNILGAAASTTIIDGGGVSRVVTINSVSAHVTLSGLTIRNGHAGAGGGISNVGILTLVTSSVSGNTVRCSGFSCTVAGGGIYNGGGTITIQSSTISGNSATCSESGVRNGMCVAAGGGIYNSATLIISNSTVVFNRASASCSPNPCVATADGGGIYNHGTTFMSNSTAASNTAFKSCLFCYGQGGGISNRGTASISSSTFSGNSANSHAGAIYNYVGYSVTLQNSIVANSSGGNCSGVTSHGYNLSSDGSCNFSNTGDMNNTDPMLGTLGSYGGPTQTIPLLSGSPATDAGNPSGCTDGQGTVLKTDQRGEPRPDTEDRGGCDMGAYERQSD